MSSLISLLLSEIVDAVAPHGGDCLCFGDGRGSDFISEGSIMSRSGRSVGISSLN